MTKRELNELCKERGLSKKQSEKAKTAWKDGMSSVEIKFIRAKAK